MTTPKRRVRKPAQKMSLRQCRTERDIIRMPRDNFDRGDWWFLTDGYRVTFAEQKMGEAATQSVTIPKGIFDRFVDIYVRPVKPARKG